MKYLKEALETIQSKQELIQTQQIDKRYYKTISELNDCRDKSNDS